MTSLWPESSDDPNAFLRESLGPLFEDRSHLHTDRYSCTRWAGNLCTYTYLPRVGASSLDLLRAHDPAEFDRMLRAAGECSGVIAIPEKLGFDEWARRYPFDAETPRDRVEAAIATRGVRLDDNAVGLKVSIIAWQDRGVTENTILDAMGLTVEEARIKVRRYSEARSDQR